MKNIKNFEYYYDDDNKIYNDLDDIPYSILKHNKFYHIPKKLEEFIPEIEKMKNRLREINDEIETYEPLDEDIENVIESLDIVLKKWENRPINKSIKKYNL